MKLKELATDIRFWAGFGLFCMVSLTALGATVDRPVWLSELTAHAEEDKDLIRLVGYVEGEVLQIKIDTLTRAIWEQEDRNKTNPTQSGIDRLRELKEQRRRLEEKKNR